MAKITLKYLHDIKNEQQKFAVLTAYDATFCDILNQAGVEVILVGDTLGCVIQGHATTIPVTLEEVIYHLRCVKRTNNDAMLIGDLPFMSYANIDDALYSSAQLMQNGAEVVKLEGGAWLHESIYQLTERGIPVCAHLGLTPQSVHKFSGHRVQGREAHSAQQILADAMDLQEAGASLLVLECIPATLAAEVTQNLSIPTIGIGAGRNTDGQVLVLYDMLGISGKTFKFCKNFLAETNSVQAAIKAYVSAVKEGSFPSVEHEFE